MSSTIGRFPTPREMAHEFFASIDRTDEPEPQGRGVSDLRDEEPCCDCGASKDSIVYREHYSNEPHGEFYWDEWYECSRCGAKYTPEEMERL